MPILTFFVSACAAKELSPSANAANPPMEILSNEALRDSNADILISPPPDFTPLAILALTLGRRRPSASLHIAGRNLRDISRLVRRSDFPTEVSRDAHDFLDEFGITARVLTWGKERIVLHSNPDVTA